MAAEDGQTTGRRRWVLDASTLSRLILIVLGLIALLLVATVPAGQTAPAPEPCNDSVSGFGNAPLIVTDIRGDPDRVVFVLRNTGQTQITLQRITVETTDGRTVATEPATRQIDVGDIAAVPMQDLSRDSGCHSYPATLHFDAAAPDQTTSGTVTGNFQ